MEKQQEMELKLMTIYYPRPRRNRSPTKSALRAVHAGFTLLEMMIVLVIVGILSTIALPSYQAYVYRAKAVEVIAVLDKLHTVLSVHQNDVGKIGAPVGAPTCIFYNEYIGGGGHGTLAPPEAAAMVYRPYVLGAMVATGTANLQTVPVVDVAGMRKGELTVSKVGVKIFPGSCIGKGWPVGQYSAQLAPISGLSPGERESAKQVIRAVHHIMQGQVVKATLSSAGSGSLYFQL